MDNQRILQLKKERRNLLICGVIIMVLGYAISFALMAADSPFTILGMIVAFAGIIMILRSFIHQKYKDLNRKK